MEAMRESWTDDRLDDLNGKVDGLRVEMKTEFAAVRGEMRDGFDKVDARFDRMEQRFDRFDKRFERMEIRNDERFERSEARSEQRFEAMMDRLYSMQRQMIQVYTGLFAASIAAVAGLIVTRL